MGQEAVPVWFVKAMEEGRVPIGYEKPTAFYPDGYFNISRVGENYYATDAVGDQYEFLVKNGRLVKRNKLTAD